MAKKTLAVGDRAPQFSLPRLDGGEVALRDLVAHGPALLAFFKVTCPVCQMTLPYLERMQGSRAFDIYGVSQNDAEDTRDFCGDYRLTFPMLLDPEDRFPASNAFGITHVPTLFLVDTEGRIAAVVNGWSKRDMETLATRAGVILLRKDEYVPEWKAG